MSALSGLMAPGALRVSGELHFSRELCPCRSRTQGNWLPEGTDQRLQGHTGLPPWWGSQEVGQCRSLFPGPTTCPALAPVSGVLCPRPWRLPLPAMRITHTSFWKAFSTLGLSLKSQPTGSRTSPRVPPLASTPVLPLLESGPVFQTRPQAHE